MPFDPVKFLKEVEAGTGGFDPEEFLAELRAPAQEPETKPEIKHIKGTSRVEGISKTIDPFDLPPEIPMNVKSMDGDEAENIELDYKRRGLKVPFEVVYGFGPEGDRQKLVIPKNDIDFKELKLSEKEVDSLAEARKRNDPSSRTNIFEQLSEAYLRPTGDLMLGAIEIGTGEKQPQFRELTEYQGFVYVPFEDLSGPQKVAAFIGGALGYMGPGVVFHSVSKGSLKIAMTLTMTRALAKSGRKHITRGIGRNINKIPDQVKGMSTVALKGIVRTSAGMLVKNNNALMLEGAAWTYLHSRGDIEEAAKGAVIFSLVGSGLMAAGAGIQGAAARRGIKRKGELDALAKEEEGVFGRKVTLNEKKVVDPNPKMTPEHELDLVEETLKKMIKSKETTKDRLVDGLPEGITEADRAVFVKEKQVEIARMSAESEIVKEVRAAKLLKEHNKNSKQIDQQQKIFDHQVAKRDNEINKLIKKGNENVEDIRPTNVSELKVSDDSLGLLEETLEEFNGSLESLIGTRKEVIPGLRELGINSSESNIIYNQVNYPVFKYKKLTATKAVEKRLRNVRINQAESKMKSADKKMQKLTSQNERLASEPMFDEGANIALAKADVARGELQLRFKDKLTKQGLYTPNMRMFSLIKWVLPDTSKWARVDEKLGIPVSNVIMSFIESTLVKNNLLRNFAKKFNPGKTMSILKSRGTTGKQMYDWLHYVHRRKLPNGAWETRWDPKAIPKGTKGAIEVPEFVGTPPEGKTLDLLIKLRDGWGDLHGQIEATGKKIGYLSNYVPKKNLVPMKRGGALRLRL